MTFDIRLRPEAEQDLADAAAWYERHREGLGHEFLDEVLAMLVSIAETPLIYSDVHRNAKRAIIRRFPFGIYFRVENETIIVLAVMHASRHPRRWKSRV